MNPVRKIFIGTLEKFDSLVRFVENAQKNDYHRKLRMYEALYEELGFVGVRNNETMEKVCESLTKEVIVPLQSFNTLKIEHQLLSFSRL